MERWTKRGAIGKNKKENLLAKRRKHWKQGENMGNNEKLLEGRESIGKKGKLLEKERGKKEKVMDKRRSYWGKNEKLLRE